MTVVALEVPKKVEYVRLGKSGLKVSKLILGCMSYGKKSWADWLIEDESEVMAHFETAFKAGINTWDTADVYSNGESEVLVGKAMRKLNIPREELVILTKCCMVVAKDPTAHPATLTDPDNTGYVNLRGLSRKHIFAAVDASLERLGMDYIDLFQCHRFDYDTPIEETMDALDAVVKSGKVRYIGMSSCFAYQFAAMQNYAKSRQQTMFISMQDFYNPIYREEEREMYPTLEMFGVGAIPWSPLARGYLTRPFAEQSGNSSRASSDRNYGLFVGLGNPVEEKSLQAINVAIETIAKARGLSMAQITLAWQFHQKAVSAPIIGTTNLASLVELVAATHITLTAEDVKAINDPYLPRRILGHS